MISSATKVRAQVLIIESYLIIWIWSYHRKCNEGTETFSNLVWNQRSL